MREKQIEEMAHVLCGYAHSCDECASDYRCEFLLECGVLYNAGYRKQSEGEWKPIMQELGYCDTLECSICGEIIDVSQGDYKYCPNCGAKMKGGAE